ncbi:MAG: hypothetical protein ABI193_18905 [Minicystis sp.]
MNRPVIAALLLGVSLTPALASAQTSDADRATARNLASEGQDALEKNDFTTAADRFSRADALIHAPTLLLGLAHAQIGLGKLVTAQETYARIVREGVPPRSPPAFAKAVKDAARELDALGPRIPTVIIQVSGANGASGASVTLDGALVPSAALGVKRPVDPGKHTIRASAPGLSTSEVTLTLREGKSESVTLALTPASADTPPVAPPPHSAPPLVVSGGAPPAVERKGGTSTQKILGVSALGLGGAGLILGGVTGLLALGKHKQLKKDCPGGVCPASAQPTLDDYHLMGTLSTVGFIVGGVGVAGGAVLFLTAPSTKPAKEATLVPVVGAGYLGVKGTF